MALHAAAYQVRLQQEEYKREGVACEHISFPDNAAQISLLDHKSQVKSRRSAARSVVSGQWSMVRGWWSVVRVQWKVASGERWIASLPRCRASTRCWTTSATFLVART